MALEQITFNIGAFNDSDAGGNNYFTNTVFEVKNQSDNTFATIYADSSGTTQIPQNGIDNISNSIGECNFYIDEGEFYIEVDGNKKNFKTKKDASAITTDSGASVQEYIDGQQFESIDAVKSYANLSALIGYRIQTKEYHAGTGYGGASYDVVASSGVTPNDIDIIQGVADSGASIRLASENLDILKFGADGTLLGDSSAAQAMADYGLLQIVLPYRETPYLIEGVNSVGNNSLSIKGVSSGNGEKPTINAASTIITVGADTGAKIDDWLNFEGFRIVITGDVIDGLFDMGSCRNFEFADSVYIEAEDDKYIGTIIKGSRTYQFTFKAKVFVKGVSICEIGDDVGGEVLDSISFENCLYNGNAAFFQRSNIFAFHNIQLDNAKFREKFLSPEADLDNCGMTNLSIAVSAGATEITVDDASQLRQGNLAEDDLLYIGRELTAEIVRISSVSGNTITLDTPCRFSHSIDVDGSGFGEPVIFGPVYLTFGASFRGLKATMVHFERAWAAIHAKNLLSASLDSVFTTSRHLLMLPASGRGCKVGVVSGGNTGWSVPVNLMYRPNYANPNDIPTPWKIDTLPEIEASFVTQIDDSGNSMKLWDFNPPNSLTIDRDFTETLVPARNSRDVTIDMDGSITSIKLQTGIFIGQECNVIIRQDSTGKRIVFGFDPVCVLLSSFKASLNPNTARQITFRWDGSNWNEVHRTTGEDSNPLPSFTTPELSDSSNNANTNYKYAGIMIVNSTSGQVLQALDSAPSSPWKDLSGTNVITPS